MISSLKRKVFWSILLSAVGVLLAILLAFNVLNVLQTVSKADSILDSAMFLLSPEHAPEGEPERVPGDKPGGDRDRSELLRSVSKDELGAFALDENGMLYLRVGCTENMEDNTVSAISAAALADADGHGSVGEWKYRAVEYAGGTGVLILNAASLNGENVETALLSLLGFAAACCLFALLARVLSRAIVKPVEENMQMQKRFVADASHELKTPLTVIGANATVLEESIGQNKWLDYIKEQIVRMSGLVNELLQLSNLEADRESSAPHKRETFDAAEAVMAAALPFESVAFERSVALETDVPDALVAYGSRKELEQLAAILIDNAVKHSPAGGTVQVSLVQSMQRHGLKEESSLELHVANSGEEIPQEALPHIFDRFYRVDESRTHKDSSYGLGLAIAKGLAEKNDGVIAVASHDGRTEFTLTLPIA